jgi:hypothetical protein
VRLVGEADMCGGEDRDRESEGEGEGEGEGECRLVGIIAVLCVCGWQGLV